ncbi:phage regulatory CII family protein [Enterobacter sp.]|uniref:phage regulatory CII family protein n=1 Tax=Enterobacter sp. TaxID=42895 RepID=UPI00296FCDE2|nr:phage regulatory CII family protein [Enterobacter sp.]
MYDYKVSDRNHLDNSFSAFAQSHNVEALARAVGMRPATLRCKLNPDQPHQPTVLELLAITDHTEDIRILDGLLRQINCQPSVPVNNVQPENMQFCALTAAANVGVLAGEAVSTEQMTAARRNQILDRASDAIRSLSLIVHSVEARFQSVPVLAAAAYQHWNYIDEQHDTTGQHRIF